MFLKVRSVDHFRSRQTDIERQRETERDRERQRETETKTDRKRDRKEERERERERKIERGIVLFKFLHSLTSFLRNDVCITIYFITNSVGIKNPWSSNLGRRLMTNR